MDGGQWLAEGRDLSTTSRRSREDLQGVRARSVAACVPVRVQQAVAERRPRSSTSEPAGFTGEIPAPPGLPKPASAAATSRAKSIPWGKNCNEDGTFKSFDELKALYAAQGITGDQPVIAYCRIGERSSLTWFTMKHLLGFKDVRNYDGSWTEWGNLVGAPVEKP